MGSISEEHLGQAVFRLLVEVPPLEALLDPEVLHQGVMQVRVDLHLGEVLPGLAVPFRPVGQTIVLEALLQEARTRVAPEAQ